MPIKSKAKAEKKPEAKPKAAAKATAKTPAKAKAAPAKAAPAKPKAAKQAVTLTLLRAMAKDLEIKGAAKLARNDLIHAIQVAEGHAACYARIPDCGQMDCLFRPDCLPEMGVQV